MTPLYYLITAICTIGAGGDTRCASLQVEGIDGLTCIEHWVEDAQHWLAFCDFDAGEKLAPPPVQTREFRFVYVADRALGPCTIARTTLWCRR